MMNWKRIYFLCLCVSLGFGVSPVWADLVPASGLQIWLDANNADGQNNATLSDGSEVATWKNLSTDAASIGDFTHVQVSDPNNPVGKPTLETNELNGKSVLRFDSTGTKAAKRLVNSTPIGNTSTSEMSVFAVVDCNNSGWSGNILSTRGSSGGISWRYDDGGDPLKVLFINSSSPDKVSISPTYDGFNVMSFERKSWRSVTIDANALSDANVTMGNYVTATGTAGTAVGANAGNWSASSALDGDIAEIIVYNRLLTEEETNQVGYYLAEKYNITTGYTPEPCTMVLLATGAVGFLRRRRGS